MGLDAFVGRLAGRFTVVTYDPMGLAHGCVDVPAGDQRVQAWSDGARRVLDAVLPDGASAYAFGSSSGGIAVLDLLARHPERLRHIVAHEPPCVEALPDATRHRAAFAEVYETHRRLGTQAAVDRLGAALEGRPWEAPSDEVPERVDDDPATPLDLFLSRVLRPFTSHPPDLPALAALSARLTVAVGEDSQGLLPRRAAESVAERTGGAVVEFPGGHVGALTHPVSFADRLARTLSRSDVGQT
jgi:pimeloyl-ACP methyl ester carboxylesterase